MRARLHVAACAVLGLLLSAIPTHAAPGDLDTSFGNGGKVIAAIGALGDLGRSVAVQGGGKIVVTGHSYNGGNSRTNSRHALTQSVYNL